MAHEKGAILIVVFGTTVSRAAEAFDRFEIEVKKRFPDMIIHWAYTSSIVRKKLAARGEKKESVIESLEMLARNGFKRIIIQSLHTIAGVEYHKMRREISIFKHKHISQDIVLTVGSPLLSSYEDVECTAKALIAGFPQKRKSDEALIYMGHGSKNHASDLAYTALASVLKRIDNLVWMGTVEGYPAFDEIVKECKISGCNTAFLLPFMAVAGDHAINDMAGNKEKSWKSVLEKNGIRCRPLLAGTLDNVGVRNIWLNHLEKAYRNNERK